MRTQKSQAPNGLAGSESNGNANGGARINGHNGGPPHGDSFVDRRWALLIAVRDDKTFSARVRNVGMYIVTHISQTGLDCRVSLRRLANLSGIGINQIAEVVEIFCRALGVPFNLKPRTKPYFKFQMDEETATAIWNRGKRNAADIHRETMEQANAEYRSDSATSDSDRIQNLSPVESDRKGHTPVTDCESVTPKPKSVTPKPKSVTPKPKSVTPRSDVRNKTEDRQTDGLNGSVVSPGRGKPDNVVPMGKSGADKLFETLGAVLKPFGQIAANEFVQDMISWNRKDPRAALSDLVCKIGIYGTMNTLEAWQATRAAQPKKPAAYFTQTLTNKLKDNGKVDIPEPDAVDEYWKPGEWLRAHGRQGL